MKVEALNQTTDHHTHTRTHISVSAHYCALILKSVEEVENKHYAAAAVFYVLKGLLTFFPLHVA